MGAFTDKVAAALRGHSALAWIVAINVALFFVLRIAAAVMNMSGHESMQEVMLQCVEMPASLSLLALRPWTPLTYMFCQFDAMHLILNMLILYWIGTLFTFTASQRSLVRLYIAGGLAGAAIFAIWYAFMAPAASSAAFLIGSSAAVFAILTATAIRMPHAPVRLFLIGEVQLRWVVIAIIGIDIAIGTGGSNFGGHLAHLGGVFAGAAYCYAPRITRRIKRKKKNTTPVTGTPDDTRNLDAILDKIKRSGYASLTPHERKTLFEISSRIK